MIADVVVLVGAAVVLPVLVAFGVTVVARAELVALVVVAVVVIVNANSFWRCMCECMSM